MRCHLEVVATLAEQFAAKFGAAEMGRAAGLLHDIGKYSVEFQRKLRGENLRVDHSTAGARIAEETFRATIRGKSLAGAGRILAYVVAAHHAGLANGAGAGARTPLQDRLRDASIPKADAWRQEIELPASAAMPQSRVHPNPEVAPLRGGLQRSLLARMVFSCLIDADRTDTGEFYATQKGAVLPVYDGPRLLELKTRLAAYIVAKFANADGEVNRIRAEVLAAARDAANRPQGLFSLTVPTGGGKTLSSLAFALEHALAHGLDRVIYVIPFTSIIEQNADVFREALGAEAILEHHSAFDDESLLKKWGRSEKDDSEAQAGERLRLAMETWDKPIVVTTAVQFFESLFSNRTTQCRKLHNIAKSVVILDEAQMLPLRLLEPCIAVLDELARNYRTSVVLCTATQPAVVERPDEPARSFEGGFRDVREIAPDPPSLFQRLSRFYKAAAVQHGVLLPAELRAVMDISDRKLLPPDAPGRTAIEKKLEDPLGYLMGYGPDLVSGLTGRAAIISSMPATSLSISAWNGSSGGASRYGIGGAPVAWGTMGCGVMRRPIQDDEQEEPGRHVTGAGLSCSV